MLAVRPLEGCKQDFLKNLEIRRVYPLYNDYEYIFEKDDTKGSIIGLKPIIPSVPPDFFNVGNLNINISAIVGKNGCGKSSLMELFFWTVNNFATNFLYNIKNRDKVTTHTITAELLPVKGVHCEFFYAIDNNRNTTEVADSNENLDYTNENIGSSVDYYKITVGKPEINSYSAFKLIDGLFHPIDNEVGFGLKSLFYTEVVNYSHYAYNSRELGDWLTRLFHKNDSYQTPLVLNPMRTEGNFDINTENSLMRQRLLTNLLRPSVDGEADFRMFGDNLKAHHLLLKLKSRKKKVIYSYDERTKWPKEFEVRIFKVLEMEDDIIHYLMRLHLRKSKYVLNNQRKYFSQACDYILYKIISIMVKYSEYHMVEFFRDAQGMLNSYKDELPEYKSIPHAEELKRQFPYHILKQLIRDESHITFKLKQCLNYLAFDSLEYKLETPIEIEKLSTSVLQIAKERNLIEFITPPFFKIDIILRRVNDNKGEDVILERLSSGEKQLIYTVSSILYHLYNLDSVSENKMQYKNINLVLEEIELYFHPEYQKKYVNTLRKSIKRLNLRMINSINIILVTHSPFILSDIPKQNILYLDVNKDTGFAEPQDPKGMKSFGANISDLLADSFFIKEGLIGDFAKGRINEVLGWLQTEANTLKANTFPKPVIEFPVFDTREETQTYYRQIIELIDEPLVKQKLRSMYVEFVPDDQVARQQEIQRLKQTIEKLELNINA